LWAAANGFILSEGNGREREAFPFAPRRRAALEAGGGTGRHRGRYLYLRRSLCLLEGEEKRKKRKFILLRKKL